MLASLLLPRSFLALLDEFRPVFSRRSFANFLVLVAGFVHALGHGRISDAIRAAGSAASKHFGTYYRFFSRAHWCLDALGLRLLEMVLASLPEGTVELVLDDSLFRRSGKKVALAGMHKDPLSHQGHSFLSYGHVYVVLSVRLCLPNRFKTGWALPFLFRLFESGSQGGRCDAPSDRRRAQNRRRQGKACRKRLRLTDREVQENKVVMGKVRPDDGPLPAALRPTKLELAAQMVLLVAKRFPQLRFRVISDSAYAGRALIQTVHDEVNNVSFLMRGRGDAVLYGPLAPRQPGQMGRPRVRGERLQNPQEWTKSHPDAFEEVCLPLYGKEVPARIASYTGIWYRPLPGRQVRYAIVQDPAGIYEEQYFFSTDPEQTAAQIIVEFSHRWPLERTFQDVRDKLGVEDAEVQHPHAVRRVVPFLLLLYSLVVLWYLRVGHLEVQRLPLYRDPWYAKPDRPSFSEMLASLRRLGWALSVLDPSPSERVRPERWLSYLVRVVAAA